jgi:hypothetical protein
VTRSFFGAMRLIVDGREAASPAGSASPDVALTAVDADAWRRWAFDGHSGLTDRRPGDACRLPKGGTGRVTEVFEEGRWVIACEPVFEVAGQAEASVVRRPFPGTREPWGASPRTVGSRGRQRTAAVECDSAARLALHGRALRPSANDPRTARGTAGRAVGSRVSGPQGPRSLDEDASAAAGPIGHQREPGFR